MLLLFILVWRVDDLYLYTKRPKVFFTQFASKNELPGFSKIETLVWNGLIYCGDVSVCYKNIKSA